MTKAKMKRELNKEMAQLGMYPNVKEISEEEKTFKTVIELHTVPDETQLNFWMDRFKGRAFILKFELN